MKHIRQATIEDIPLLLPLVRDYWRFERVSGFESKRVAAQLARLLSEPSLGRGWIAFVDDVTVGYLLAVYVFSLEHLGITAEIDEFFVTPSNRGRSIGHELLIIAESEFRRIGCTNVSLQLSHGNNPAREFYNRHGYKERSRFELLDKMLQGGQLGSPVFPTPVPPI